MPRVDNLGKNVHEFCKKKYEPSSTHDVCMKCYRKLFKNPHCFDSILTPYNGDPQGEFGWLGDMEHPPYDDTSYKCSVCGNKLADSRDGYACEHAKISGPDAKKIAYKFIVDQYLVSDMHLVDTSPDFDEADTVLIKKAIDSIIKDMETKSGEWADE